jgi:hypothetical protein
MTEIRRLVLAGLILVLSFRVAETARAGEEQQVSETRSLVLIELFTSEGCSSCPPADNDLINLKEKQPIKETKIIALAFHVDYWDDAGWKDRFSSKKFTERQQMYSKRFGDEPATPQLIVDGVQLVQDGRQIPEMIFNAGSKPKPVQVNLHQDSDRVDVLVQGAIQGGEAYLALVEDDLETPVKRGENQGRTLHHAAVVRDWHSLGTVATGSWNSSVHLSIPADANRSHMQLVGFVQDPKSGKILGVRSIQIQ